MKRGRGRKGRRGYKISDGGEKIREKKRIRTEGKQGEKKDK